MILTHLPFKDLVRVTRVCHTWREIIFTSATLRHDLLLEPAQHCAPTHHPRLNLTWAANKSPSKALFPPTTPSPTVVTERYDIYWRGILRISGPWRQAFLRFPQCNDVTLEYGWRHYDGEGRYGYSEDRGEIRIQDEQGVRIGALADKLQDLTRRLCGNLSEAGTPTVEVDPQLQRVVDLAKIGGRQLFYFKNVTCRVEEPYGCDSLTGQSTPTTRAMRPHDRAAMVRLPGTHLNVAGDAWV